MALELRERLFSASMKRRFRIYSSDESFLRHLVKHVLSAPEAGIWRRHLPSREGSWPELVKPRHRRRRPEDFDLAQEGEFRMLQSAYNDLADYIEEGLSYADRTPLFAVLTEKTENPCSGAVRLRKTYLCLSREGCLLYARGDSLRTAFFTCTGARSMAPYDIYWAGLHKLLADTQRAESGLFWYNKETGLRISGIAVERVTAANLRGGRNPWPKPKTPYARARVEEDDPLEARIRSKYLSN